MVQEDNEIICNFCKKSGHLKSNCLILLRKNQAEGSHVGIRNGIAGSASDVILNTITANDGLNSKIWIGDSVASCHYCNSEEVIDSGWKWQKNASKEGWKLEMHSSAEKWRKMCPCTQRRKLCTRAMDTSFQYQQGFEKWVYLDNENGVMKLMKRSSTLCFDRIFKTKNGFVWGIKLLPILGNIATTAVEGSKVKPKIKINNLHSILGHCSELAARPENATDLMWWAIIRLVKPAQLQRQGRRISTRAGRVTVLLLEKGIT